MANWVVVISGGIGSGKSLVAEMFKQRGIKIVEQDDISREVVEPGQPALDQIAERFGAEVLLEDGTLNRPALRERIFSDTEDKVWLERLLHPLIGQATLRHVSEATSRYAMVINPLLRTRQPQYDRFLIVDTPVNTQIERTVARDGISRNLAEKMVASQTDRETRLRIADDVIINDGSTDKVADKVDRLHRRYLVMAC